MNATCVPLVESSLHDDADNDAADEARHVDGEEVLLVLPVSQVGQHQVRDGGT